VGVVAEIRYLELRVKLSFFSISLTTTAHTADIDTQDVSSHRNNHSHVAELL